jgi:hypothetical protein
MEVPVTISTPSTLFQKIYVDVMYMPAHGSYHYIVAAKDDLTGITEARALQSIGSEALANFFSRTNILPVWCCGTDNHR